MLTGCGSVNVSAATNLINPNLTQWVSPNSDAIMNVVALGDGDIYRLSPAYQGTAGDNNMAVYLGYMLDRANLRSGNSYTFSFHLPSPDEIREKTTYKTNTDTWFNSMYSGGALAIVFGTVSSDGSVNAIVELAVIDDSNFLTLAGKDYVHSFTCPDYSAGDPCIFIFGSKTWSGAYYFLDNSLMLIDNAEEDEDNFLSKIFEWFQEKFDAIGDSFSNLGNKLSTGFTNLGDRIKTFFSDLGTSISNGLNSVKEGIQNKLEEVKTSLVELREGLINGIKGLFIPDDDFISGWKSRIELLLQEHLGIVWEAANFFTDLFSTVSDLLSDTENGSLEFTFPGVEFELLGHNFDLWEERVVDMSFLETDSFWSFWYGLYKIILVIILCFALVLYGYNTLEGKLRR